MSPRAAWRLESLGFSNVSDYVAGEADWLAFGLPTEGIQANAPRAGRVARGDAPTCDLTERVSDLHERMRASGWDVCVVVNAEGIVLGRVRAAAVDDATDPDQMVEAVMEAGPTTVRPSEPLDALVERMRHHNVASIIVSTSDGRLLGVIRREDAEQWLATSAGDRGA